MPCIKCRGVHDRMMPCFVQPCQYVKKIEWYQQQQQQPVRADGNVTAEDAEEDIDSQPDDDDERPRLGNRRRKPVRYVFWDVESELRDDVDDEVEMGRNDDGEEQQPVRRRFHRAILVCADVICELCLAAGINVDREGQRRAPGCFCGVPWRLGAASRRFCLPHADQQTGDGRNPRRMAFHCFEEAQPVSSAIALFLDFLLHEGPLGVRTIALAHNGVQSHWVFLLSCFA